MYKNREINLIVATDLAGGIGYKNKLPWPKIPEDMAWFKQKTLDQIVIMGRKTAESIGRLLPDRHNIIITSILPNSAHNFCHDLESALISCLSLPLKNKEIFIIGGGQLYQTALDMGIVDKIWKTTIHGYYEADTHFYGSDNFAGWHIELLELNDKFDRYLLTKEN